MSDGTIEESEVFQTKLLDAEQVRNKLNCNAVYAIMREMAFERSLNSAPNSRTSSLKHPKRNRFPDNRMIRRNSVPDALDKCCDSFSQQADPKVDTGSFKRVRSFKMTKKGLVKRGDTYSSKGSLSSSGSTKRRQRIPSDRSDSSTATSSSGTSSLNTGYYRIVVYGGPGVGKRSLVHQLTTSEYLGTCDVSTGESDILCTSSLNTGYYRIVVYGGPGVGKRSLVHQLTTSEYLGTCDVSTGESDTFMHINDRYAMMACTGCQQIRRDDININVVINIGVMLMYRAVIVTDFVSRISEPNDLM